MHQNSLHLKPLIQFFSAQHNCPISDIIALTYMCDAVTHPLIDWCECWTSANTLLHQIRPTLLSSPLSLSSHHFNFLPLLLCSVLSPLPQLLLPGFIFLLQTPFSLCPLLFPYADKVWSFIHTTHRHAWSWLKDVYCTWADTQAEPAHRWCCCCCIFRLKLWIASRPEMKTH